MQHVKIYIPCNFEVNSNTYFGVIALFHQIFKSLILFVLYFKNYEIDVNFKLQTCSTCQDLPTLQFLAHLYELLPSLGVCRPSVNLKKKTSPLKQQGQFKPSLAWIILRGFPLKDMSDYPADQPSWPPCL